LQKIKRLRIGIIFNFSQRWMGGIVYILNLIQTLDFLDDKEKPEIILFYRSDLEKFVDEINYPYFKAVEWRFPSVYKGYLKSWIVQKNIFVNDILEQYDLDSLYPVPDFPVKTRSKTKLVSWYADLQHKYYPEFFTRRKIIERNARIRFMLMNSHHLVLSSQAVADDFSRFFNLPQGLKLSIFHFVSVVDNSNGIDIKDIKVKYNLPDKYFMISNQFPKHKNHKILFDTLALLKEKGIYVNLAITGRFPAENYSAYIKELHDTIKAKQLQNQLFFLGVIPRNEQLAIMKHSQATIQPSLFEGWSTVIEDARSLQVPVIASGIPANIEQLGENGMYFNPLNPSELASILIDYPERNLNDQLYQDYSFRIKEASKTFLEIFS